MGVKDVVMFDAKGTGEFVVVSTVKMFPKSGTLLMMSTPSGAFVLPPAFVAILPLARQLPYTPMTPRQAWRVSRAVFGWWLGGGSGSYRGRLEFTSGYRV